MFSSFESPIFPLKFKKKFLLLSLNVVEKTSEFVKERILEMYHFIKSCRKVSKNLAQEAISVCSKIVNNIINAKEKKDRKKSSSKKQSKNPRTPLVPTKRLVNKVAKDIDCTDPTRQRDISL